MTSESATALRDYLLGNLRYEFGVTRKVLAAVPSEGCDYKPSEKCMSGITLASHIATAEAFFLNGVLTGEFARGNPPELKTPADVIAFYDANVPALYDKVAAMDGEALTKPVNFFNMWTDPAVNFLGICLKHGIHHRGQLSAYLRPMGVKVPGIYGPSADEPITAAGA